MDIPCQGAKVAVTGPDRHAVQFPGAREVVITAGERLLIRGEGSALLGYFQADQWSYFTVGH